MIKQILFGWLAIIAAGNAAIAQLPFATIDSIDVNNINAAVLVHGDMWWNPGGDTAHCYFPATSGKNMSSAGAVWMSGYDGGGLLHIAAQTYRQDGNDYWPGPAGPAAISYDSAAKWAKIWKVNRAEITAFLSVTTHNGLNTPQSILRWPGKGNSFAQGNGSAPLAVDGDMAPFVDLNGNGIYEPLEGEYPDVKGEQALWWVFNDNGPAHSQSHGTPLGMEVHAMAYAYKRGTLIDNVVYYQYELVNRSANAYSNFRFGLWNDANIGWAGDDYIGFDSVWRMAITYNGNNDDGVALGHPMVFYGLNPPMAGVTLIELPGDTGTTYVPAGSFIYCNNDLSASGNPLVDTEYNNYMRAKFRAGMHVTNDFAGAGMMRTGYGPGPLSNYVFQGDPSDTTAGSECAASNTPGDRRFILSGNDFTIGAGQTKKVVFAHVVAASAGGCGQTNFDKIKTVADTAWYYHHNPVPVAVPEIRKGEFSIYPNPAFNTIFLQIADRGNDVANVSVYDIVGQMVAAPFDTQGGTVDVSSLRPGIYYLSYTSYNICKVVSFLKQ